MKATNIGDILERVEGLLVRYPALAQATIERSGVPNDDPRHCPWVGLYRTESTLMPRIVGTGYGFMREQSTVVIMCQESDMTSGAECQKLLDDLVTNVLGALLSDQTANARVDTTLGIDVRYDYDYESESFFQRAMITVRFQSQTQ